MSHNPTTLDSLAPGEAGVIVRTQTGDPVGYRLMEMGLVPGVSVEVVRVAPLGNPMDLRLRCHCLSIRKEEARRIVIAPSAKKNGQ